MEVIVLHFSLCRSKLCGLGGSPRGVGPGNLTASKVDGIFQKLIPATFLVPCVPPGTRPITVHYKPEPMSLLAPQGGLCAHLSEKNVAE